MTSAKTTGTRANDSPNMTAMAARIANIRKDGSRKNAILSEIDRYLAAVVALSDICLDLASNSQINCLILKMQNPEDVEQSAPAGLKLPSDWPQSPRAGSLLPSSALHQSAPD